VSDDYFAIRERLGATVERSQRTQSDT
jgi:hypothetical protein